MTPLQLSSIVLSTILITACSEEQPPQSQTTPMTLDTEDTKSVILEIPSVGDEKPDVVELETDGNGLVSGSIERSDVPVEPEAGDSVPTIDIPHPLLLSTAVHNRFSSFLQGPADAEILDAVFYPLGWSTDGKIAYAIEPPDEAVGSYFLNIYIQDLVTDKILWQKKYQSEPESTTAIASFAAYWQANHSKLEEKLKQYGIKQTTENALFAGAINHQDDRIDYVVKKKLKAQADLGNLAMVTEYQVQVTSEKHGRKTVHKQKLKNLAGVLDVDVIGYLRNEDPERVALLVAGVRRGWEGPPHTTWFKVIGTNLRVGFKK